MADMVIDEAQFIQMERLLQEYKGTIRQLKATNALANAHNDSLLERLRQAHAKLAVYEFVETEPLDYPLGMGTPEQEAQWKRQEQGDWS